MQPQRRAVALHVTLQTVAEKAGVSASTASRALAGSGGVSAETTERVLQIAKELGYVPRKYHRKTKKLQTKNVVVLSNRKHHLLNNPFYSQVVSGIESVLSEHGCQLVYKTLAGDETDDPAAVEAQVAEQDGIILVGYEIDRELIRSISRRQVPFVLVDNDALDLHVNCVVNEDQAAAQRMVRHLIDLGHRRIAFLGGPAEHASLTQRYRGYLQALAEAGLDVDRDLVAFCSPRFRIDDGQRAAHELLTRARLRPTALFAANDGLAIGAVRAAQALGLDVPGDLSVAGFDDIEAARLITPPLTTVRVFKFEMGVEAGMRLIHIMRGTVNKPLKLVLPTEIVYRESTAKP